jgi:hypothetical protein
VRQTNGDPFLEPIRALARTGRGRGFHEDPAMTRGMSPAKPGRARRFGPAVSVRAGSQRCAAVSAPACAAVSAVSGAPGRLLSSEQLRRPPAGFSFHGHRSVQRRFDHPPVTLAGSGRDTAAARSHRRIRRGGCARSPAIHALASASPVALERALDQPVPQLQAERLAQRATVGDNISS